MLKDQIKEILKKTVLEVTGLEIEPEVFRSADEKHGDYSTNIAMTVFAKSKVKSQKSKVQFKIQKFGSAMEVAEKIASSCQRLASSSISKIETASPGFINFYLSDQYLVSHLQEVSPLREASKTYSGKRIMVEYAHPNTHKEFHIGHLRNVTLGESICRILEANGARVNRVNYQGDVGLHVAKAIYGIMNQEPALPAGRLGIKGIDSMSLEEKARILGKAYAFGSKAYEEDEKAREEIMKINKQIYAHDPKVMPLWEKTRQWSLDYFDSIYKRLGTKYDRLFFESEVFEPGKKIVSENIGKVFVKDDGAIIFDPDKIGVDGEKYGLHKRVFITKDGNPTYEGKEMGLGPLQYNEFKFDKAIHVVGPEQAGYFLVVFKALELLDPVFKDKEKHLAYGLVQLREGKMSSRSGNVISGVWLLDEAKERISKLFPQMDQDTLEKVAVGAVKYSMLKYGLLQNIKFSFEESVSLEGNSGSYIQYTYARTQSVLSKTTDYRLRTTAVDSRRWTVDLEPEETSLLRAINHFPEVVLEAGENLSPNLLCNYLFELCQKFNLFYQKHKIIGSDKEEFRLALTEATGQILKKGLYLLGIEAPERM